jgi:hypothetical protein
MLVADVVCGNLQRCLKITRVLVTTTALGL